MQDVSKEKETFAGFSIQQNRRFWLAAFFLFIGVLSRIIPHLPNSTAIAFSSLALGFMLPRALAMIAVLIMALISDAILAYMYGYPCFGYWSFFTYSGFLASAFMGSFISKMTVFRSLVYLLSTSFLFWVWTNLGVWLLSAWYAKTVYGFIACYTAALPFLRNQLLGDLIWGGVFILVFALAKQTRRASYCPTKSVATGS